MSSTGSGSQRQLQRLDTEFLITGDIGSLSTALNRTSTAAEKRRAYRRQETAEFLAEYVSDDDTDFDTSTDGGSEGKTHSAKSARSSPAITPKASDGRAAPAGTVSGVRTPHAVDITNGTVTSVSSFEDFSPYNTPGGKERFGLTRLDSDDLELSDDDDDEYAAKRRELSRIDTLEMIGELDEILLAAKTPKDRKPATDKGMDARTGSITTPPMSSPKQQFNSKRGGKSSGRIDSRTRSRRGASQVKTPLRPSPLSAPPTARGTAVTKTASSPSAPVVGSGSKKGRGASSPLASPGSPGSGRKSGVHRRSSSQPGASSSLNNNPPTTVAEAVGTSPIPPSTADSEDEGEDSDEARYTTGGNGQSSASDTGSDAAPDRGGSVRNGNSDPGQAEKENRATPGASSSSPKTRLSGGRPRPASASMTGRSGTGARASISPRTGAGGTGRGARPASASSSGRRRGEGAGHAGPRHVSVRAPRPTSSPVNTARSSSHPSSSSFHTGSNLNISSISDSESSSEDSAEREKAIRKAIVTMERTMAEFQNEQRFDEAESLRQQIEALKGKHTEGKVRRFQRRANRTERKLMAQTSTEQLDFNRKWEEKFTQAKEAFDLKFAALRKQHKSARQELAAEEALAYETLAPKKSSAVVRLQQTIAKLSAKRKFAECADLKKELTKLEKKDREDAMFNLGKTYASKKHVLYTHQKNELSVLEEKRNKKIRSLLGQRQAEEHALAVRQQRAHLQTQASQALEKRKVIKRAQTAAATQRPRSPRNVAPVIDSGKHARPRSAVRTGKGFYPSGKPVEISSAGKKVMSAAKQRQARIAARTAAMTGGGPTAAGAVGGRGKLKGKKGKKKKVRASTARAGASTDRAQGADLLRPRLSAQTSELMLTQMDSASPDKRMYPLHHHASPSPRSPLPTQHRGHIDPMLLGFDYISDLSPASRASRESPSMHDQHASFLLSDSDYG